MSDRELVFPSKVDLWLAAIVAAPFLVGLRESFSMLTTGSSGAMHGLLLLLLLGGGAALLVPVRYSIGSRELIIRSGVLTQKIPLEQIRRVYPSRSLLASAAWSMDRLAIECRYSPTVYISPRHHEVFLDALAAAAGLARRGKELVRSTEGREATR